jgi:hypothetical protein
MKEKTIEKVMSKIIESNYYSSHKEIHKTRPEVSESKYTPKYPHMTKLLSQDNQTMHCATMIYTNMTIKVLRLIIYLLTHIITLITHIRLILIHYIHS